MNLDVDLAAVRAVLLDDGWHGRAALTETDHGRILAVVSDAVPAGSLDQLRLPGSSLGARYGARRGRRVGRSLGSDRDNDRP